jgi:hypothetical protein
MFNFKGLTCMVIDTGENKKEQKKTEMFACLRRRVLPIQIAFANFPVVLHVAVISV